MKLTLTLGLFFSCLHLFSDAAEIRRYCFGEWCERIGYSEAVAVGDTLYLSGIVGEGDDMEACLKMAFDHIDQLLARFNLGRDCVLKEKIYTNSKDALRAATQVRRDFYGDALPAAVWIEAEPHRTGAWIEMELVLHLPEGHLLPEP